MFAVTAVRISPDDPLPGLAIGEHQDPSPPQGWTTVSVRAAALNHHDVWSLRGVGMSEDRLPIILGCDAAGLDEDGNEVVILGCDAAGLDEDGNEVVIHSVVGDPEIGGGDET